MPGERLIDDRSVRYRRSGRAKAWPAPGMKGAEDATADGIRQCPDGDREKKCGDVGRGPRPTPSGHGTGRGPATAGRAAKTV
jgi:hypothetical protein